MKITRGTNLSVIYGVFILLSVWSLAAGGHGVAIGRHGVAPAGTVIAVNDNNIAIIN
jgi:hypothetical protein